MEGSGRFDRYALLALLDRGGMGSVYRARDERLDREVAIKIVRESGDSETRARVLREARAVAALEHPNVVAVYDVDEMMEEGETTPTLFIAMELVRGESLRSFIGRASVPLAERVRWLRDIAMALGYAHENGIIHRDVKPENVMIRLDGVVKVLDFGIARRGPTEASRAALPTLTGKGTVMGTPRYMAPEQMLGEDLDGRADQFAWGVIAYELIAGQPPWSGTSDSLQAVAEMLVNAHAPLRERAPEVPEEIGQIIERSIQRARRDRFPNMGEVAGALDEWLFHNSAPVTRGTRKNAPARRSSSRTRYALLAAATVTGLGVCIAVVGTFLHHVPAPATPSCAADADCGKGFQCVAGGRCVARPTCSPKQCTESAGAPSRCREDGACVPLASEDCRVVSTPQDVGDDRTVWVGAMFPLTGADAEAFGLREFHAVDLARTEIARVMSGTNARADRHGTRPIALLACDDAVDPTRAAHHLVDDVGVPAVIGFRTSQEAIDVATSTLLPRGVLAVSALNTSPMLTRLLRQPGQPRLIWRTAVSAAESALAAARVVPGVLEPMARLSSRGATEPLRVALVRQDDPAGQGFADALFRHLEFNGRSAVDNGSDFQEFLFPFGPDATDAPFVTAARKIAAFAPQVIVYFGADETFSRILVPLESSWSNRSFRPRYLKPAVMGPPIAAFIGRDADRRHRFFGMTSTSSSIANARFIARYNETYDDHATRTFSPNSSYDAFYLIAYATYAAGDGPMTGVGLAHAFERLLPPGTATDVGPQEIFPALDVLASGRNIDLNGATGHLDFDPSTGEAAVDMAVLCFGVDAHGGATDGIESGVVFDATSRALHGALACP